MSETSNEMVVDRESLLHMTKDDLLYIIGHEFGHFSIADDKTTKDQTVSQYIGNRVKEESSTLEAKEASESTWKMLAKNSNLMTGAIAKEKAEAISMENREYKIYQLSRQLDYTKSYEEYIKIKESDKTKLWTLLKAKFSYLGQLETLGNMGHGYFLVVPDNQDKYFINGKIKEKYKKLGYPEPQQYGGKLGWTVGGHQINEKLIVVFDQEQDKKTAQKILNNDTSNNLTILKGYVNPYPLKSFKYREDDVLIEAFMKEALSYKKNNQNGLAPKYSAIVIPEISLDIKKYNGGYNCNSFTNTISDILYIKNFDKNMPRIDPGDLFTIPKKYFESKEQE